VFDWREYWAVDVEGEPVEAKSFEMCLELLLGESTVAVDTEEEYCWKRDRELVNGCPSADDPNDA
jgi:hypothetical protein